VPTQSAVTTIAMSTSSIDHTNKKGQLPPDLPRYKLPRPCPSGCS
jgi:hypothetical protein